MTDIALQEKLPWHSMPWGFFVKQFNSNKMPHGLILSGVTGLGKVHFATQIAAMLLCEQPQENAACQTCGACHLFLAGNHPDFHLLTLEDSQQIKVADIRAVSAKLTQTSQQNGNKVVLIHPAEAMNLAASNALLKTLEEPSANTVLILVTALPESLLATIRSRCQTLRFATPNTDTAMTWLTQQANALKDKALVPEALSLAQGAPLLALSYTQNEAVQADYHAFMRLICQESDPIRLTQACLPLLKSDWLVWLQHYMMDLIRCKHLGRPKPEMLHHQSYSNEISERAAELEIGECELALEKITELAKLLRKQPNLNLQLQLEALFIGLYRIYVNEHQEATTSC